MPKSNIKGGKKHKRGKKHEEETKELILKEEGQEYAIVNKKLGGLHVTVTLYGKKDPSLATIRGNMKKKVWINEGNLVLVSSREFQEGRYDIIHLYSDHDFRQLKKMGEIDETMKPQEEQDTAPEDDVFVFEDV